MGMGRWPYGYYKMGLRKGKRRMGIPEGVPEMIDESEDSSSRTTTSSESSIILVAGHENGAVHHESEDSSSISGLYARTTAIFGHDEGEGQHEQEAQHSGPSFVEEEAANKRQKVRAALVDAVTAPALDLPALQRQSLFALAMLIAARPLPPTLGQQAESTFGQQPLLAPKPWFLDHEGWQFLHDASRQQIRAQGGRLPGQVS